MNDSFVAKALFVVGWIQIIACIIVGIIMGNQDTPAQTLSRFADDGFHWSVAIKWSMAGIVSGLMFMGFSEVITYLEIIAYNTQRRSTEEEYKVDPRVNSNSKMSLDKMRNYKMGQTE